MQTLQPIYVQLENLIRDKISQGEYPVGSPLPSERKMAETYGINRMTVRAALKNLQKEGIIKAEHGRGYFVQDKRIRISFSGIQGFGARLKEQGVAHSCKVITAEKVAAGYVLAKKFGVPKGTMLFHLTRVRFGNGQALAVDDTYLIYDMVKDIEKIDFAVSSLYDTFEQNGIKIEHASQYLTVFTLHGESAKVLELAESSPVFCINHCAFDNNGKLVEYTFSYVNPQLANIASYLK